jgi:hypothetical protein
MAAGPGSTTRARHECETREAERQHKGPERHSAVHGCTEQKGRDQRAGIDEPIDAQENRDDACQDGAHPCRGRSKASSATSSPVTDKANGTVSSEEQLQTASGPDGARKQQGGSHEGREAAWLVRDRQPVRERRAYQRPPHVNSDTIGNTPSFGNGRRSCDSTGVDRHLACSLRPTREIFRETHPWKPLAIADLALLVR